MVQRRGEELFGGSGVFPGHQVRQTSGTLEPRDQTQLVLVITHLGRARGELRGGDGFVDVADDVGPVLEVHRDLDHVDAHGHHVSAGGAVVSGT